LTAAFAAGLAAGVLARVVFRAAERDGLEERVVRRLAAWGRFFAPRAARAGLRLDEVRAFAARRNFAMPGW
jgi:hypothetical protein